MSDLYTQSHLVQRRAASSGSWLLCALVFSVMSVAGGAPPASAQDVSKAQVQSLDEQVQEIKSDVLGIAAELSRLEERLLYPSNTQVAIFVSLAEGETFRLDSLQIQIDSEPVAHHVYSFKELEALQKGGVQRIYTGNIAAGEHQLEVRVVGKTAAGRDFDASERLAFRKEVEPKLVEVSVAAPAPGSAGVRLRGW